MRVMISRSNVFMIYVSFWKIFNNHIDSCLMSDDGSCAAAAGHREEMEPAGGAVDLPASEVNIWTCHRKKSFVESRNTKCIEMT